MYSELAKLNLRPRSSYRYGAMVEALARFGYAAKGVVYALVGILAVQAAVGTGGKTTGSEGALQELASASYGRILLVAVALGLFGYVVWKIVQSILDVEGKGSDLGGMVKRLGYFGSALIHIGLAVTAIQMLTRIGGASRESSGRLWAGRLMQESWGFLLIGIAGLVIIAVGFFQFRNGFHEKFRKTYKFGEMSAVERQWIPRCGKIGLISRGAVFVVIGVLFLRAASQGDAGEIGGVEKALDTLLQQDYGPWLLAFTGVGLMGYAVHCFARARYRRIFAD